jgi:hypothetical protein
MEITENYPSATVVEVSKSTDFIDVGISPVLHYAGGVALPSGVQWQNPYTLSALRVALAPYLYFYQHINN